ncbi:MAG: hypothetical protein EPO26_17165 [Chloroflexota bacterium]|nr:MAG: hypothetical protein EPO26_17165 [Chloroflexota bacterium]
MVVRPTRGDGPSYLKDLYAASGRSVPEALADWEEKVDGWTIAYRVGSEDAAILEVKIEPGIFAFDRTAERVVLAYGLSAPPSARRDASRMRGFPDVSVGVHETLGERAFLADRGHFLAHGAGGSYDINLFPQRRDLNRGWSTQGRLFRQMEKHVAGRPGTFYFHRAIYVDDTWIPGQLEFGVLVDDQTWWVEVFDNR